MTEKFPGDANKILLYGGGGHGKTLIDLMRAMGGFEIVGVVDDQLQAGSLVLGVPVLGGAESLPGLRESGVRLAVNGVGGIGNVSARLAVFDLLRQNGFDFPTLIHPSAVIEPSASLAPAAQILAQTYVSSAAAVGFGTVLNAGVIISHDCVVGEVVNLSPGAALAGGVRVEDHVQIGMNATINLNLIIGRGARIGNGATVKADVPPGGVVRAGTIWPPRI